MRASAVGAVAVVLLISACADSGAPTPPTTAGSAGPTSSAAPAANGGTVSSLALPAGICRSDAPAVRLVDGAADNVAASLAGEYGGDGGFQVRLVSPPSSDRGDLDGDGRDELAVVLSCGGYGGGNKGFTHIAVLRTGSPGLALLADLQPDSHGVGVNGAEVSITPGALRSVDQTYAEGDAQCCPTSRDVTEWRWQGGRLDQTKPAPTAPLSRGGEVDGEDEAPREAVAVARAWYEAIAQGTSALAAQLQTPDVKAGVSGSSLDEELVCRLWKAADVLCTGFYGGGDGSYATAVEISLRAEGGRWLVWHATEESAG